MAESIPKILDDSENNQTNENKLIANLTFENNNVDVNTQEIVESTNVEEKVAIHETNFLTQIEEFHQGTEPDDKCEKTHVVVVSETCESNNSKHAVVRNQNSDILKGLVKGLLSLIFCCNFFHLHSGSTFQTKEKFYCDL